MPALRAVCGPPAPMEPRRLLVPGTMVHFDEWRIHAELVAVPSCGWSLPSSLWELMADADALTGCIQVRMPRPGDRVRPLGVGGRRKLQDVFVDRKLPLPSRRICPVVE